MESDGRKAGGDGSRRFGADTVEREIRERVRHTIELIVEEELDATWHDGEREGPTVPPPLAWA